MSLHVCVLGIDGSGKSTIATTLPAILAAEHGLVVGSASDSFRIVAPDQDHLESGFYPDGLPIAARLSLRLRRLAKRLVDHPKLYAVFKLGHMLSQDSAAEALIERHGAKVFISDGNAFLSATGRASNYLRTASADDHSPAPEAKDLQAVFSYIIDDKPVPAESTQRLPSLRKGKLIYKLTRLLRLRTAWLPNVVIFLDVSSELALERIKSRGQKVDRHENLADLTQAREMYLKTLQAFQAYRTQESVHVISVDELSLGETLQAVSEALKPHLRSANFAKQSMSPLGTTELADEVIRGKTLNHRYLFRYLLLKCFSGAWREPTFFFSKLGRLFLKEGYSAGVMRAIYDRDEKEYGWLDRVFLEYSLHRAVYDRLQILVSKIGPELEARLATGDELRIFTAPSGFAYDLFRPLEAIAQRDPEAMKRVYLTAADLDPHGILHEELSARARRLGIRFTFHRGDITDARFLERLEESAPFDLALFVGLSSWLPKPHTMRHLAWLHRNLAEGGLLITDCFTPEAYALSGRYVGYKANYYTPDVYKAMLDFCGFDGLHATVDSGRDRINHVVVAGVALRGHPNVRGRVTVRWPQRATPYNSFMGLDTFNKRSRPFIFRKLAEEQFDLLVIGGGITGASIFRDAALRGMKVALVEARDFASATSGRSSKLIHGGLRYIKNLGLGLAWESCHERNLHIRLNKRLVRPLPFLVPLYRDRGERRWLMRLGMLAYEALSGFNNYRFHKFLNREETLSLAPALPAKGLTGGCLYYDAVINDSRWTMEVLKDGVANGGLALNYAPVTQLLRNGGRIVGARINDCDVRARVVVNATGIFADQIRQLDGHSAAKPRRLSKGTHLVFAEEDVPLSTTIVFSSPLDGRSLFLAKHEECFLFGTSDHWEEANPELPIPAPADVDYLLTSLNRFMPEAQLDRSKVKFVYSGFRPLLSNGDSADSSSVTREDHIEVSPSGLVSVVGGKLTTARITAARVLDRVIKLTGRNPAWSDCKTGRVSIGGTNEAVAESLAYWVRRCPKLTSYFRVLYQRYGLDANEICAGVTRIHEQPGDPTAEPIRAEVQYVCRHEMVCTLEDLIDRRAGFLYWNAEKRLERLRYGANVIRAELDLSEAEFESQWLAYRDHLKRFHSLPESATDDHRSC